MLQVIFHSPTDVELLSSTVSEAPPPVQIGAPPEIDVMIADLDGTVVNQFNDWHPLWIEFEDEDGERAGVQASSGEGRFVVPFLPEMRSVLITDVELDQALIEVDARQIVLAYCAGSPSDPGCASVPGPVQLPGTGGAVADDGSSDWLLWIAAISAAMVAATGGTVWLAHERRRAS